MKKNLKETVLLLMLTVFSSVTQASNVNGIDSKLGSITLALSQEPSTLNPLTAESVSYTAQLLVHLQEGLLRYDRRRQLVGGVAQKWEMTDNELHFWLRSDAKWQNGEAVTAQDFVYAWQQLIRPDTGSPSANLASPIKNAAKIIRGELPVDALGVEAINETELLVRLEHPCAWCLKLMTSSIFYPIQQEFYEKQGKGFANNKAGHLSNGAFKIENWQRGKQIRLVKNPNYWGSDRVKINALHFDYIGTDAKTLLNLFRSGEIAVVNLDKETISDALDLGFRLMIYPTGHLFHLQFSHLEERLSANWHLRKALSLVIDKDEIVNRIVASPGTRRADSMFHDWLTVGGQKYLSKRPPNRHKVDYESARTHLRIAKKELGLQGSIQLSLTVNDSSLSRRIAEYLHQQFKRQLDVELAIDPQLTQVMVEKWRKGSSDMTLITWPVDVDDPMDQISFMTNPDFRRVFKGLYGGVEVENLYLKNKVASKLDDRLDAIDAVQKLFEEKVTVFPLFESYGASSISSGLKGFVWQPVRGYGDFRYAQFK